MATKLEQHKSVKRESTAYYRGRPLIVELHPTFLRMRQKGKRSFTDIDYVVALEAAFKIEFREKERERKAAKKKRKG